MKCIIVDDDDISRLITKKLCEKHQQLELINQFDSPVDALKFLNNEEIDLIFLDIHMPTFNGFDFMETLKSKPQIILTTSDENFALKAFEYPLVVDYLLKPINEQRFNKALEKVNFKAVLSTTLVEAKENQKHLFVNVDKRLVKIDLNDINLVEAKGDYVLIKTKEKNYIVHSTLKNVQDKLPESIFCKVHRSFLINLSKIVDIEDSSIVIGNDVIPISRSNKQDLMDKLNLL